MRSVSFRMRARLPSQRSRPLCALVAASIAGAICATPFVPSGSAAASDPAAAVTLDTAALSFADSAVGARSDAKAVEISNTGDAPLAISTFHIDGADAGDFGQGATCPIAPDTLAAGASCEVYVSFAPSSPGAKSAALTIGDDATSSPQTVALSGTGIATPEVRSSPSSLAFGTVEAGDRSAPQTVTLTNSGTATLELTSLTLAGADAAAFSQSGTTCDTATGLAAGASCAI